MLHNPQIAVWTSTAEHHGHRRACRLLSGDERRNGERTLVERHYAHALPSGKSHVFSFGDAVVMYSIPANMNIARYLLGPDGGKVWELSRLWAPDGHERNLLTMALAATVKMFRALEPSVAALVSYADPNVGHEGFVYRAASWMYCGRSEEGRYYRDTTGQVVSRRKFHSGSRSMTKAEILALGYEELRLPGKHRFARGLTPQARKTLGSKFAGWGLV